VTSEDNSILFIYLWFIKETVNSSDNGVSNDRMLNE
jgi:hypothetical protein